MFLCSFSFQHTSYYLMTRDGVLLCDHLSILFQLFNNLTEYSLFLPSERYTFPKQTLLIQ